MKSNQNLSILFWHRKSKADINGYAPIICRISIDGKQTEFSIARRMWIEIKSFVRFKIFVRQGFGC
ncbi:hypothetical protein [Pedobacter lusitanus]|uniref:hypothetical protein n=1 Tax=Pedobacter lusitanus TaxID=1503925 RepID=UPI0039752608